MKYIFLAIAVIFLVVMGYYYTQKDIPSEIVWGTYSLFNYLGYLDCKIDEINNKIDCVKGKL